MKQNLTNNAFRLSKGFTGSFYILAAAVLWSTGGVFIKIIPADPLVIAFFRALIAGLALLPISNLNKIKLSKKNLGYFLGYIISFTWMICSFVTATKLTAAANAVVLQYTAPLFIFLCSVFTGREVLNWRNCLPMLFILAGIMLFLLEPAKGSSFMGNLLGISSGVVFATMTVFLSRLNSMGIGLVSITNFVAALIISPFLKNIDQVFSFNLSAWLALFYLGVIQIALAYIFYSKGLKEVTPLRATMITLMEAVLNPVWVFFFLGEIPSNYALLGSIFILGAVICDVVLRYCAKNVPQKEISV